MSSFMVGDSVEDWPGSVNCGRMVIVCYGQKFGLGGG